MTIKNPIITSLLDTDYYKFTMGQFVLHHYDKTPVRYAFQCRTKNISILNVVSLKSISEQINSVRNLKFSDDELQYLYSRGIFKQDYLDFLKKLKLPPVDIIQVGGNPVIETIGNWSEAIYWETFILSIVNELYYRDSIYSYDSIYRDAIEATGIVRLKSKIDKLQQESWGNNKDICISDFGTRRRFSKDWHDYVVKNLADSVYRRFVGTSNVAIAKKYNISPMGTMAHELFMITSGIARAKGKSLPVMHNMVYNDWYNEYGYNYSIMLTDTYGTDFFFDSIDSESASMWRGIRHDSGDPIKYGNKVIQFYKNHGIDPMSKTIIFSDGLDVDKIITLSKYFDNKINVGFGWGTNLTNDLGYKPLSLVVKPIEACGYGLVKLSDNLAKAVGKPEDIRLFKKLFKYNNKSYSKCKY